MNGFDFTYYRAIVANVVFKRDFRSQFEGTEYSLRNSLGRPGDVYKNFIKTGVNSDTMKLLISYHQLQKNLRTCSVQIPDRTSDNFSVILNYLIVPGRIISFPGEDEYKEGGGGTGQQEHSNLFGSRRVRHALSLVVYQQVIVK